MSIVTYGRRALHRGTYWLRPLPRALLIGGMRCGTTSLNAWLHLRDDAAPASLKEIHFFDRHFDRGVNWYRSFFPVIRDDRLTYDATPSYLSHPETPARAATVVPEALIVVTLRNPVDRAWSHYRFRRARGSEPRTFAEALEDELATTGDAALESVESIYLAPGLYAHHLRPWFALFDPSQILVLESERLFEGDTLASDRLEQFLGLSRTGRPLPRYNAAPVDDLADHHRAALEGFYGDANQRLVDFMERAPRWAG